MESKALNLANIILKNTSGLIASNERYLVGIAGIPASGKSTFAEILVRNLNGLVDKESHPDPLAVLVGLDGWHLTRAQLDAMEDPKLARDRRGAHWTFDGEAFVRFVQALRRPVHLDNTAVILAPSFDHALKDPVNGSVSIHPYHRIVVIEGLYTFLSIHPWNGAGVLLQQRVLIDIQVEQARQRLIHRHIRTGVTKNMDEAIWRANENDMPNGQFILENSLPPTLVIESIDDASFAPDVLKFL